MASHLKEGCGRAQRRWATAGVTQRVSCLPNSGFLYSGIIPHRLGTQLPPCPSPPLPPRTVPMFTFPQGMPVASRKCLLGGKSTDPRPRELQALRHPTHR